MSCELNKLHMYFYLKISHLILWMQGPVQYKLGSVDTFKIFVLPGSDTYSIWDCWDKQWDSYRISICKLEN